jgi:16S rRNA (cytidine1402-2'-O)-methyltransferase
MSAAPGRPQASSHRSAQHEGTPVSQPAATPPRQGKLYLVPAPLDFGCDQQGTLAAVLPQGTLHTAARLTHWICENAKSTRAYLKRVEALAPLALPLQSQTITELPREVHKKGDHQGGFDARPLLAAATVGHDIGLVSEAGMPAVADPGSSVVRAAHDLGIEVVPLTGPVSLLLALAASGLNGQNFAFVGYLPQDAGERVKRIRELESLALKTGQTQLFIETPYRNSALLQALTQTLQHNTRLAVSSGLTLDSVRTRSQLVKLWRQNPDGPDNHTPAVFAIGR